MSDGRSEVLVAKVLQPPSDCRNVRKLKQARLHAAAHGQWDLKLGHIPGQPGAKRLDQRFLDGPQKIEQVKSLGSARQCQVGSFTRPHHAVDESIEIALGTSFLQVHTEPSLAGKGNQAMCAAVTDIEADGDRFPLDHRIRLSEMGCAKGKLLVPATEPATENGPERGATQSKPTSRTLVTKASPTRPFFLVEPP